LPYRVVVLRAARDQLRDAPPILRGYVDGILAVLRVDPSAATAAFEVRVVDDDYREAIFAGGRGIVGYWLLEEQRTVAVVNVTLAGLTPAAGEPAAWVRRLQR
jgi:hypothetical protein